MAQDEELSRATVLVHGSVQGVFYRASTMEQAQRVRVTGWVQNLADGGVEILVEGPKRAIEELIEWCKHGPPDAKVQDVTVRWSRYTDEFRTFMIRKSSNE